MTRKEFNDWRAYHCETFRGVEERFIKLDQPQQQKTLARWEKIVGFYSYDDCVAATDDLHARGELLAFDQHPKAIADLAQKFFDRRQRPSRPVLGEPAGQSDIEQARKSVCEHYGFDSWAEYKAEMRRRRRIAEITRDPPTRRKPRTDKKMGESECRTFWRQMAQKLSPKR